MAVEWARVAPFSFTAGNWLSRTAHSKETARLAETAREVSGTWAAAAAVVWADGAGRPRVITMAAAVAGRGAKVRVAAPVMAEEPPPAPFLAFRGSIAEGCRGGAEMSKAEPSIIGENAPCPGGGGGAGGGSALFSYNGGNGHYGGGGGGGGKGGNGGHGGFGGGGGGGYAGAVFSADGGNGGFGGGGGVGPTGQSAKAVPGAAACSAAMRITSTEAAEPRWAAPSSMTPARCS